MSEEQQWGQPEENSAKAGDNYPAKPVLSEKQENVMIRSLISLLIYAFLFYFLFDQDIVYIAAILLVLLVHELGHFAMMRLFNYSNVKIFIVPLLGAFTSGKKQEVSQWQLSLIILAGPVPGIIAGSIMYWYNQELQHETLGMLANSFLIINLLNLFPFYPLDGGRLLETLFFRDNYLVRLVFGIISIIALCFLFLFSGSWILMIIPVLMVLELRNEGRHEKIREYLRQEKINYYTEYANLPDKDYWLIRDCLIFSFPRKYGLLKPGHYDYSIIESAIVRHISSVLKTKLIPDLNLVKRIFVVLFYLIMLLGPVILFLYLRLRAGAI